MLPSPSLATAIYLAMGAAWLFVLGFGLVSFSRTVRRRERGRWGLLLFVLFAVGLALRLLLATWGPGDDQFRLRPLFYDHGKTGFAPFLDLHLGSAPIVVFQLLFSVVPLSDTTIIVAMLLCGAAAPVLLVLTLREMGASRVGALGGGAMLMLQPIAVRFSGEMARMSVVLFLGTTALWALARYRNRGGASHLVLFVAGAWLCARTRPEAGMILGPAGLAWLIIHLRRFRALRDRRVRGAAAAIGVAGILGVGFFVLAAHFEPMLARHLSEMENRLDVRLLTGHPWFDTDYTSPVAMGLSVLGAGFALWRRERVALWAFAATAALIATAPPGETAGLQIAYARYQGLMLLSLCALGGFGWQALCELAGRLFGERARAVALAVVAAGLVGTTIIPLGNVTAPRTIDYEYHFVRRALAELPEDAVIYWPFGPLTDFVGGFRDVDKLSMLTGRGEWRPQPIPEALDPQRPAYYYRSPACYSERANLEESYPQALSILERCQEGMTRARREGGVVTEIPARKFSHERWTQPVLTIGFYRLDGQ